MNRNEFCKEVKIRLQKLLGEEYEIQEVNVPKLNGTVECCLSAGRKGERISACIHMESDYPLFCQNSAAIDMYACETAERVKKGIPKPAAEIEDLTGDWEKAKGKLMIHLVNTERNSELLREVPFKPYLNLSCIFYLEEDVGEEIRGAILVNNCMMGKWQQNVDSLYEQAIQNMDQSETVLERMDGLIKASFGCTDQSEIREDVKPEMYVLHNNTYTYGAAVIVSEKARNKLQEQCQGDMYILPSSVHELIFLPKNEEWGVDELLQMVKEVNQYEVSEEDFLADNVYLFKKEDGSVRIAA